MGTEISSEFTSQRLIRQLEAAAAQGLTIDSPVAKLSRQMEAAFASSPSLMPVSFRPSQSLAQLGATENAIAAARRGQVTAHSALASAANASAKAAASRGAINAGPANGTTEFSVVRSASELSLTVRAARKQMKMNQQTFADYAGVGRRFVSELENGKGSLEFDKVLACAQAAGVDILVRSRRRP